MKRSVRLVVGAVVLVVAVVLPRVGGVAAWSYASDDFNRAASTNLGASWNEYGDGSGAVSAGGAYVHSGNVFTGAAWVASVGDGDMEASVTVVGGTGDVYLYLRATTNSVSTLSANTIGYVVTCGCLRIYSQAGAVVSSVSYTRAALNGHTFSGEAEGTAIRIRVDGVEVLNGTVTVGGGTYSGFAIGGTSASIDNWEVGSYPLSASPPVPSCAEIGVGFEHRAAGVGTDWSVVDLEDWPSMSFGDSIRWTMQLPDSAEYAEPVQVDHLAFFQLNDTPIRYTGDYPNYRKYHLEGFSRELIDPLNGSWPTDLTEQVASGVGVTWAIRPGDGLSQEQGPFTHTGTFLYLGKSGLEFELLIDCHMYGADFPIETLRTDGTSYDSPTSTNSGTACQETRIVWKSVLGTDTQWGFDLIKAASETNLEELHWRYMPAEWLDPLQTAWTDLELASLPEDGDLHETILIAREDAPNPYLVQWKCVESVAGGGTNDVELATEAPGNGVGAEGQESCYGEALASMELTRPASWVAGAGRMGVCLVEWLFVPDDGYMADLVESLRENTEDTVPFSMVYEAVGIVDSFFDAAEEADGGVIDTGMDCDTMVGGSVCAGATNSGGVSGVTAKVDTPDLLTGENRTIVWGLVCIFLSFTLLAFAWTMVVPAAPPKEGDE